MEKKLKEVYQVYNLLKDTKMFGMETDKMLSLVNCAIPMRSKCEEYDQFKEQSVKSIKPSDWDEKLPLISKAEKGEINGNERDELISYRDAFISNLNDVLSKKLNETVVVDDVNLRDEDWMAYLSANNFTLDTAVSIKGFFINSKSA